MQAGLPATIHRPSMVVGDSQTGKVIHFQVFYHLCEFLSGRRTLGIVPDTGDAALDGEVSDCYEMVHRLAKSQRVRQSFVRHAFRYWMGCNEISSDSTTLIAADKAYVDIGGSFRAMLLSLLTSDSFLYRKPMENSRR